MSESPAFLPVLARELELPTTKVESVVGLLGDGNTVPFIARYRKEATGNLDEVQIRSIQERHAYFVQLEERKVTILNSIEEQGKLTDTLRRTIVGCDDKTSLEDIYRPYKPKRKTRATIARAKGLTALADRILDQPRNGDPRAEAATFVNPEKEVNDVDGALFGARDIVAEAIAEMARVRAIVRDRTFRRGLLTSRVAKGVVGPTKFEQYYDYQEPVASIPSHRYLAVRRGENEKVLKVGIDVESEPLLREIQRLMGHNTASPFATELAEAAADAYKRLIAPSIETEIRNELKIRSDGAAVEVFADNLKNLLLAAPLGVNPVIGIDPGIRTGCKCAVVDATGKFLENTTIFPQQRGPRQEQAKRDLLNLIRRHKPFAIAVGNGTAGRETERFVRDVLRDAGVADQVVAILVNESGASVYSASDVAREEFPDIDLTVRGAISIARRLQDPLAELVKIDPKAIGVGQYQHDVNQTLLQRKLDEVVESCVNRVGVDLNTASHSLLSYVAGIGPKLASRVVAYRNEKGAFTGRHELKKVSGLGAKTFLQAAGFLRVRGAGHPLDASAVHPERYPLVETMAGDLGVSMKDLVGDSKLVERIEIGRYVGDNVGEPTLRDIIDELKKPGRDPRDTFEAPAFRDDVHEMTDLKEGMQLQGVVTNVTNFGAFVDIGVHQDGLVHISQLADRFVKDPNEVVKVGQKLTVKVLSVDLDRKRISLTAKSGAPQPKRAQPKVGGKPQQRVSAPSPRPKGQGKPKEKFGHNPFSKLKK